MSDSESDDDDLFADFEALDDVDDNINVSANLAETTPGKGGPRRRAVGQRPQEHTVNSSEKHWYKDENPTPTS